MSKLWKIILGVVVAVLILGAVGTMGFIAGRRSAVRIVAQKPGPGRELEVRLIDDNKDGVPDRGVVEMPAQGMVDRPRRGAVNPVFGPGRGELFGRDFRLDQRRPLGLFFTPFMFIGGLVRGLVALAFLALLASLALYLYRRWQPTPLAAAAVVPSTPANVPPQTPVAPTDIPPALPQTPAEEQTTDEG